MAKRLSVSSLLCVVGIFVVSTVPFLQGALATYTHPDDIHYEARVSKSFLSAVDGGMHTAYAAPLTLPNSHKFDKEAPKDESFYANGFTDEHHRPKIDFSVENGALVKVSVSFPAPHTLAMPAFTVKVLTIRAQTTLPTKYYRAKRQRLPNEELHDENEGLSFDERKYEMIMEETLVTPNAQSEAANFALHDPTPMEDLYDYVVVILNIHPRVITSFVYELDKIPDEIFESEKMFDLTPFNSTMHMKFVAKYDSVADALGVWVVRRPPIPDFTAIVAVDGKVEMSQNVAEPSPSGQGFPNAIPHAKARRNAVFRFVVHFYEKARQTHVCFPFSKDFSGQIKEQLEGSRNHRKFIDQPIPSQEGFSLRLVNDNHRDTLTVALVQPHPISSLMLSLYASYDGDKAPLSLRHGEQGANDEAFAERPILIFREEEHHVPYIAPTEASQFGWYSALPMTPEALIRLADARVGGKAVRVSSAKKDDPEAGEEEEAATPIDADRIKKVHLSACVSFNAKEGQLHPFEEMADWIEDFGGNTKKMAVMSRAAGATAARQGRHTKGNQGLAAREELSQSAEIATIPYRALLTAVTVEGNEWIREVMKNATAFVTKAVELGMDVQQNQHFMLITFFLLMQPSSVFDGTNWRQYFETIPLDTKPTIPIFLSEAELKVFTSAAPLLNEHVRTMKELIEAEYQTIAAQVPWFEEDVSRDKYAIARSQVENRVFNISGTLVMIPAVDYLGHSDDPSVTLSFDDRDQQVTLQARHAIPSGGPLTVDYGIEARNKFDFFTQFGFIPQGAAGVAGLRVKRYKSHVDDADEFTNVFLSVSDKESRAELVAALREDLAAAKSDAEGDTVEVSMVTQTETRNALLALLRKELAAMPPRTAIEITAPEGDAAAPAEVAVRAKQLSDMAKVLYDTHRAALEQHITWAAETTGRL